MHIPSRLLPKTTPGGRFDHHHLTTWLGSQFSEYVCRLRWAVSLIAEGTGMPRDEWLTQVTTKWERWVLKPAFPRLPPRQPPCYTVTLSRPRVTERPAPQHQTTDACDPPILTAGSTAHFCFCARVCNCAQEPIMSVPKLFMPEVLIVI